MKLKLTTRDLFWATAVVALLLCLSLQWLGALRQAQLAALQQSSMFTRIKALEKEISDLKIGAPTSRPATTSKPQVAAKPPVAIKQPAAVAKGRQMRRFNHEF